MNKSHIYAVILAGGSGTRFWPLSRKKKPKQFLHIAGEQTLLQQTIARICPQVLSDNIYIVTNAVYQTQVQKQCASFRVPKKNILLEPQGKNTAPAICWAASHIYKQDEKAVMLVLPSDHLILHPKAFLKQIKKGVDLAQNKHLVTLGIVPTRAETGYGYVKVQPTGRGQQKIYKVTQFTEKPDRKKAEQFLRSMKYLWNSGMFIWRCDVVLEEFKQHLPSVYRNLNEKTSQAAIKKIWHKLPGISVDYGILEKAKDVVTVPAGDIGWSDLGSWESLVDVAKKGQDGNILKGDFLQKECRNIFVHSDKRLVAAIGLEDVVVVDTEDALLVCRKDCSQQVKDIVEILKKEKREKLL